MYRMKARCSMLHRLLSEPKSKSEKISASAKSAVREIAKYDLFGYQSFEGCKFTEKGLQLEEQAVRLSSLSRGLALKKNTERRENDWISGECDIYIPTRKIIIDTKCSWDIGTHPFFKDEAEEKAKKQGYDVQMQGYMWLWDCEEAHVDFCLFPTPLDMVKPWENEEKLIDLVDQIPQKKRLTTVVIKRDEKVIEKIKQRVEAAQEYYQELIAQMSNN